MKKNIKIDFYAVDVGPKAKETFESMLRRIGAIPQLAHRNQELSGVPFRLQEFHDGVTQVQGEMVRIRMDDLPSRAAIGGKVGELGLSPDEGIGEHTAFLYDIATQVVAFHSHKAGVSVVRFAEYVERSLNLPSPIEMAPVLSLDALKRMDNVSSVRRIALNAARVVNPQFIAKTDPALSTMINKVGVGITPNVEIAISVGRDRKAKLDRKAAVDVVKNWFKGSADKAANIRSIVLSGHTPDGDAEMVDLISDKLHETVAVSTGAKRRASYADRKSALLKAWAKRANEVAEIRKADDE